MAYSKQDYLAMIATSISNYPVAAQFYQAQDPRLLAQLDAAATMLAMKSSEQDVQAMEPFTKARDLTVLADAAVKGVLPFGQSGLAVVAVANPSTTTPLPVLTGRPLYDAQGNPYVVTTGATIAPSGSGTVIALQQSQSTFQHTVATSTAFYQIPIPSAPSGQFIASVALADAHGNVYQYIPDFVNVAVGQQCYNIESDETGAIYIVFGATGIAGYQPGAGEVFTVTVNLTVGTLSLNAGSPFSFQYTNSPVELGASLTLSAITEPGSAPMDVATLRAVCSYPSLYDKNAVYLANFDFLLRSQLGAFTFLSVWNEQIEESVRGPNIANINCLFVSAMQSGVDQATLQQRIANLIALADDSYQVKFVTPVPVLIPVTVAAQVASTYDFTAVRTQISEQILNGYGQGSAFSQRGLSLPRNKDIGNLLEANVQALQATYSDYEVTVGNPGGTALPEQYRYVDPSTLTVTVTQYTYAGGGWAQ